MINPTINEYHAALRHDFCGFIERSFYELNPETEFLVNWHIEVMAAELEACRRGETKRLIINLNPRALKSHCTTVAFPAWLLGHDASAQIICVSYGQDLANKHAIDCRTLLAERLLSIDFFNPPIVGETGRPGIHDYPEGRSARNLCGGRLNGARRELYHH